MTRESVTQSEDFEDLFFRPPTRAELLAQAIEAEAKSDFEAARALREAVKQLDAKAAAENALEAAQERATALGVFEIGRDHLYTHVFDPEKCCLRVGRAAFGIGSPAETTCLPPYKPTPPGGIREIMCVLDSYPPKCGYCRKALYVLRPLR